MPLILTPRQLIRRAEFYHQLASLTAAGIGLLSALDMLGRSPPSRSYRTAIERLHSSIEQGSTLSEAMRALGSGWLPAFDMALVEAGETSGRLDVCFQLLSEYYNDKAQLVRSVWSDLAYPAFIFHFAILIFPVAWLSRLIWQGDVFGFLRAKAAILIPLYGGLLLLTYATQSRHGERWRAIIERLLSFVPILGTARFHLALARLSVALESLLNAGVSIVEAWPLAAAASGSPSLRRTVLSWRPNVLAGQTPAEAVRESGAFPEMFANLYGTGEISGQLDGTLRRLYKHYQEEGTRKLHAVAQWTPRLIYWCILLAVAYQIVSFWSGYYSQIDQLTK